MEKIKVERNPNPKAKPIGDIPFGVNFTDHMFLLNYEKGKGWFDPRIVPYGPISLDPSAMVFHYAQEVFEGLKAYRKADGGVQLFRPRDNIKRMNNSCERLCIPQVDEDVVLDAMIKLVDMEKDWIPDQPETSLYIRPFIIATDPHVGVHASHTYIFSIITCPVGAYYPEGMNPVKIFVEDEDVRAVRGGTGFTKCGGNYAATIRAQDRAALKGFTQVLWLDGVERKYIEEVGTMNVMFKIGDEIVTPPLEGSILPGITRDSCLKLLRSWGLTVSERRISIDELIESAENGTLKEVYGTGTAAVISPVGEIVYEDKKLVIGDGGIGPLTQKLYDTLTGIQWGLLEDTFGWTIKI